MKHVKNVGEKDIFAKSVKGHWYSFKNGEVVEVENDDLKHLVKRGLLEVKPTKDEVNKMTEKKEEKKDVALKKAINLKEELRAARGNIKVN